MIFMVKVSIRSLNELPIALMAIHQAFPTLLFTFAATMSGETYGVPFIHYAFYSVSEISSDYVKEHLAYHAKIALSKASIAIVE